MPPVYEYQCKNELCEYHEEPLEVEQKITDDPISQCPKCGRGLQRLIGHVAIAFKGGGWTPKYH